MNTPSDSPTYVACLTPAGTGAIATLALRGPRAWCAVAELFRRANGTPLPAEPAAGRFWLGRLGEAPGAKTADEVVVTLKRTSPLPWLELHCHGGREVVRFLLEIFTSRGLQACSWQQMERETADDSLQALALAALVEAPTVRTAAILLEQYHGAFGRAVAAVRAALDRNDLAGAGQLLDEMRRYTILGRHLTTPWRVVIAGAPNVGKSSLVNALAGYQRSIVAATPGTTRDVVTTLIAVDGWPIELADTAGLREEAATLERQGIDLALTAAAKADLCLWVLDASTAPIWPSAELRSLLGERLRFVVNKIDLQAAWNLRETPAIPVSARTGAGLEELCQALSRWLVPHPPDPGAAVPFTRDLCEGIEEAQRHCRAGRGEETRLALPGGSS
jgi:tRNA modification GTPase